eukprot:XP_001694730.1 predicted protein [Chlamydomonas reinhardtii]
MSSLDYDSHAAAKPGAGARPPPLRIEENPIVESPGPSPGPGGGGPPPGPGALVPMPAAALGLPLPAPPVGGVGGGLQRLPPLPGASSGTLAPLALMGSPRDADGPGPSPEASEATGAAAAGAGLGPDPGSDFLGEESALVYPPAGRSFGGGPSAAARTALGAGFGGGGGGGLIDPMDDFRFRGGGARKAITVEQLDNLDNLVPGRSRLHHGGGGEQLDRYLQDYARDRAKPPSLQAIMSGSRFYMPF